MKKTILLNVGATLILSLLTKLVDVVFGTWEYTVLVFALIGIHIAILFIMSLVTFIVGIIQSKKNDSLKLFLSGFVCFGVMILFIQFGLLAAK